MKWRASVLALCLCMPACRAATETTIAMQRAEHIESPREFFARLGEHYPAGTEFRIRVYAAAPQVFVSPLSGQRLAWHEWVAFTGPVAEAERSFVMLQHGEDTIGIAVWDEQLALRIQAKIPHRLLRTFLNVNFEERRPAPRTIQSEAADGSVLLREYALGDETQYFARLAIERYQLPPEPGGGSPRSRENQVLQISDVPFGTNDDERLTPLYWAWTY